MIEKVKLLNLDILKVLCWKKNSAVIFTDEQSDVGWRFFDRKWSRAALGQRVARVFPRRSNLTMSRVKSSSVR